MTIENIEEIILDQVVSTTQQLFGQKPAEVKLGFPPNVNFGDFTFECFPLAKQYHKSPVDIARDIAIAIKSNDIIKEVSSVGPYVNFTIDRSLLFGAVCEEIIEKGDDFGNSMAQADQRIMVEYLSPNTNKPLHLGHVRNGVLGMAIANLLEVAGATVIKANLINDRGIHICKSMLAWQKWAEGSTPQSAGIKGDHFVGKWYVRYNQEVKNDIHLEEKAQKMLQKWEAKDPEIIALWKKMNNWVYDGFNQTYQKFGFKFDVFYYESDTYKLGKDIVKAGLRKGIFKTEAGAIVAELPIDKFGTDKNGKLKKITVLRADGTSVYMTQDLGTAEIKFKDYGLTRSIYVVGSEQNYHFSVLFNLFEMLGFDWAKGCRHLSYGMVYLPEGKMKSREGKVVDADDLVEDIEALAAQEIRRRDLEGVLSMEEINQRASKIGIGAIKFYLLRVHPHQDIHFNPEQSISFDGCTGPYCQYTYARASGILRKAEESGIKFNYSPDYSVLGKEEELLLLQKLIQFPEAVESAINELDPSYVAIRFYEISRAFNRFYQKYPVLQKDNELLTNARLSLVKATTIVLKKSLDLLNMEILEEM